MYKYINEHFNNCWRKIPCFDLAKQLNKNNYLNQLITSYPKYYIKKSTV